MISNVHKRRKLNECCDDDPKDNKEVIEINSQKSLENLITMLQGMRDGYPEPNSNDTPVVEEYGYEHVPVDGAVMPGVSHILNRQTPFKIKTLADLIKLCDADSKTLRKYPDLQKLPKIKSALIELDNLIGMESIKISILDQILHYCQKLNTKKDMRHVMITGPPGVGKTTICNILAKIYAGLGELSKGHVVNCKRSDLIGKYLGSTSIQTAKMIESSFGGVLLLDEAYSLGNSSGNDSFSKECIDMINRYLSEHSNDFICIIVGYKNALQDSFFSYNSGLERRFKWRFNIESYKPTELKDIFTSIVKENNWRIDDNCIDDNFFKMHKKVFTHFGGDIQNLFSHCCVASSRRTFGLPEMLKKKIIKSDVKCGFQIFIENKEHAKEDSGAHLPMYV